jgi:hypothetical protein
MTSGLTSEASTFSALAFDIIRFVRSLGCEVFWAAAVACFLSIGVVWLAAPITAADKLLLECGLVAAFRLIRQSEVITRLIRLRLSGDAGREVVEVML